MKVKKYKILLIIVLSLILGLIDYTRANTIYNSVNTDTTSFINSDNKLLLDGKAFIYDVYIQPSVPTLNDHITIYSSGTAGTGPVTITSTDFTMDGSSLKHDIKLVLGPMLVVTPWSHSENIGTLPVGNYDLKVRTFVVSDLTDTYSISFEVIPEPATFILLAAGFVGLRLHRKIN